MSDDRDRQADQDNASNNGYGIKRRDLLLSGGSVFAASAPIGEALVTVTSKPANAQATAATRARVNIMDFGAVGDGVADDTAAIQGAVNYALEHKIASVYCPPGLICRTTNTIHLGYGAGDQSQSCVWLEGDRTTYMGGSYSPTFTIRAEKKDRPIINIQGARGSGVRGILIESETPFDPDWAAGLWTMQKRANGASYVPPGAKDDRNAPFCGVCIDGYAGELPANPYPTPAYPAFLGTVDMTKGAYDRYQSSGFFVIDCIIQSCMIGVCCKPNNDENGDFLSVRGCLFSCLKVAVSIGNSQARNNDLSNLNIFVVHTVFDGVDYSMSSNGCIAGTYDNLHLNWIYRIFHIGANWSTPFTVANLYTEVGMRIGDFTAAGNIRFESCLFDIRDVDYNYPNDDIWAEPFITGSGVHFVNCRFLYFRAGCVLNGGLMTFQDCSFQVQGWGAPLPAAELRAVKSMGAVFLDPGFGNLPEGDPQFIRCTSAFTVDEQGRIDVDQNNSLIRTWHSRGMSHGAYHNYDIPQFTRWGPIGYVSLAHSGRNLVGTLWSDQSYQLGDLFCSSMSDGKWAWWFLTAYTPATGAATLQAVTGYKKNGVGQPFVMMSNELPGTLWYFPTGIFDVPVEQEKFMVTTVGSPVVNIVKGAGTAVARPTSIVVNSKPFYHHYDVIERYGTSILPFPQGAAVTSVAANNFTMNQNAIVAGTWRMCPGFVRLK